MNKKKQIDKIIQNRDKRYRQGSELINGETILTCEVANEYSVGNEYRIRDKIEDIIFIDRKNSAGLTVGDIMMNHTYRENDFFLVVANALYSKFPDEPTLQPVYLKRKRLLKLENRVELIKVSLFVILLLGSLATLIWNLINESSI